MKLIICAFSYKNTSHKVLGDHIRKDIFRAVTYAIANKVEEVYLFTDTKTNSKYKGLLSYENVIDYVSNKINTLEELYEVLKEDKIVFYFSGHLAYSKLLFRIKGELIHVDNSFLENHEEKIIIILDCCHGNTFYTKVKDGVWFLSSGKAKFKEGSIFSKYVFHFIQNEKSLMKMNIEINNKIREKNFKQNCLIINYANIDNLFEWFN